MARKSTANLPPVDGSIPSLPGIIDFHVRHNPDLPYMIWPASGSLTKTRSLSFVEFSELTDRMAHVLRPSRKGPEGEVVAIFANTDSVLYCLLLGACMKAGLIPFPMSPRNTVPAVCHMIENTAAHRIIVDSSLHTAVAGIRAALDRKKHALEVTDVSELFDILPFLSQDGDRVSNGHTEDHRPYPPPSQSPTPDSCALFLHSSGSTGYPKCVAFNNETLFNILRSPPLFENRKHKVQWGCMMLPSFHGFAFIYGFLSPFVSGAAVGHFTPQYPAPPVVPNPENVLEACRITECTGIPAVPSFIEAWARSPDAINYLRTLEYVVYGGGPLPKKVGDDLVAAGVRFIALYAGTEFITPSIPWYPDVPTPEDDRTPKDWDWIKFGDRWKLRWEPQGDGSYELQFLRCETHQPGVENLPDVRGYATSDLFVPHPTKKGLWRICGRADDVIVLANGEKIVPTHQEGHIATNPMVKSATMFGRGHDHAGVIIELLPDYEFDPTERQALRDFRDKIWPTIDEANRLAPTFAKIFKEMILIAHPSNPIPRTPKGTIARKQALELYEKEINELYNEDADADGEQMHLPTSWDVEGLEAWLLREASSINGDVPVSADVDLFQQGFDSLSALFLRNRLISAARAANKIEIVSRIPQNVIFDNPTVGKLARTVLRFINPVQQSESSGSDQLLRDMVAKYTAKMPVRTTSRPRKEHVILLTGSTGNLGSHVLAALLADKRISKVFTLDRHAASGNIKSRLTAAFSDRSLPSRLLSSRKLVSSEGDLNLDKFGLEGDVFDEVKNSVTHVIHNAWHVNSNLSFSSYVNQVSGSRKLVDFLLSMDRSVQLLFTSSESIASGWDVTRGPVSDDILTDADSNPPTGYAKAKFVVEHILAKARKHGLDATCLRLGQLCGPQTSGAWNASDAIAIMVKSSLALGVLPVSHGTISWIPVDAVANITLDLVFSKEQLPAVINVVHPRPSTWKYIFDAINNALGGHLKWIPIADWLAEVEKRIPNATTDTVNEIPAIKLVDFYRGMAEISRVAEETKIPMSADGFAMFSTDKLVRYSHTARDLKPLSKEHAEAWVRYWKQRMSF